MTTLDLTVDIQNRKFYVNNRLATEVERFIFTRQDQVQFRVQPVKRNLAGGIRNPIEIVDVSPLDLQMAVGVWNAPYAAQVNWTKDEDNDWFTGPLNFNTVPLEDDQTGKFKANPSPASIPAKFHVRFIDSGHLTTPAYVADMQARRTLASKAAALAAHLRAGKPFDFGAMRYTGSREQIAALRVASLNGLPLSWIDGVKGANAEAYHYWHRAIKIGL